MPPKLSRTLKQPVWIVHLVAIAELESDVVFAQEDASTQRRSVKDNAAILDAFFNIGMRKVHHLAKGFDNVMLVGVGLL